MRWGAGRCKSPHDDAAEAQSAAGGESARELLLGELHGLHAGLIFTGAQPAVTLAHGAKHLADEQRFEIARGLPDFRRVAARAVR